MMDAKPADNDAIRVVPLYGHREAAELANQAPPPAPPALTYRGGALIAAVEVFTVFWGGGWSAEPDAGLIDPINKFFDDILVSPLIDQLGEYSTADQRIGHGRRSGTVTLATPAPAASVSDAAVQQLLHQQIASNPAFPQPSPNTLIFVYLPSGVAVTQGGSRSCQAFCGYHNHVDRRLFYAVMPYPGCAGCTGSLSALDALTSTSSHELCEAITDPVPGEGWYDDTHGEIGDICAWQTKQVAGHTVQLEWSNAAGACV
ncbi:MAG: hypothetical protein QOI17_1110 [Gaiellales bacterium]|nr:hypothetical protein [Gaiellales bacterium]